MYLFKSWLTSQGQFFKGRRKWKSQSKCVSFFGIGANRVLAGTKPNNNSGIICCFFHLNQCVLLCEVLPGCSVVCNLSQPSRIHQDFFVFKLWINQFCSLIDTEGIKGKIKSSRNLHPYFTLMESLSLHIDMFIFYSPSAEWDLDFR